jgi:hypothetical protein
VDAQPLQPLAVGVAVADEDLRALADFGGHGFEASDGRGYEKGPCEVRRHYMTAAAARNKIFRPRGVDTPRPMP